MTAPADGTGPSAGHNITAGTGTGGGKNPFRTLLVLGGASALLAGTAQALGSPALALAAFLPSLALNHRAMKPATRVWSAGAMCQCVKNTTGKAATDEHQIFFVFLLLHSHLILD